MLGFRTRVWMKDVAAILAVWAILLQAALGPLAASKVMAADPHLAASICRPAIDSIASGGGPLNPSTPEHHDHSACWATCQTFAAAVSQGVTALQTNQHVACDLSADTGDRTVADHPAAPPPARGPPLAS